MSDRISTIVANSIDTKRRFFDSNGAEVERAAELISDALKDGGRLLTFGFAR